MELPKTVLDAEFIIWPEEVRWTSLKELENLLEKLGKDAYFKENLSSAKKKELRDSMNKIIGEQ